ncbi:MAG: hypothetical protein JXQ29_05630 [Planctomycetes bacterium]|nr:hypothetical protein [Planctomycetota bacterium]
MEASRAFGAVLVEAALLCVVLPALACGRRRRALAVLAGCLGLGGAASWLVSGGRIPLTALAAAQGVLLAFGVFVLGLGRLAGGRTGPGFAVVASLVGLALLASPFLADPFLEDRHGRVRPVLRDAALGLNPLGAVASRAVLGVDWLRAPRMYRAVKLGPFHAYRYPSPWVQAPVFFLAGAGLLLLCRGRME